MNSMSSKPIWSIQQILSQSKLQGKTLSLHSTPKLKPNIPDLKDTHNNSLTLDKGVNSSAELTTS